MKKKFICKIIIDMVMTILLLLLMAKQITGESVHEWLGTGMMFLWVSHNILNRSWYVHFLKGSYSPIRIFQTFINLAVFLSMLGLMISGIILSREVFAFLPISGGMAMARTLHMLSAFWGYMLMALHLGLHWDMILSLAKKAFGSVPARGTGIACHFAAICVAGYGLYAFINNQFSAYIFLTSSFVFFDFERSVFLFFLEYIGIMGLFICLAHYVEKGLLGLAGRRKCLAAKKEN